MIEESRRKRKNQSAGGRKRHGFPSLGGLDKGIRAFVSLAPDYVKVLDITRDTIFPALYRITYTLTKKTSMGNAIGATFTFPVMLTNLHLDWARKSWFDFVRINEKQSNGLSKNYKI